MQATNQKLPLLVTAVAETGTGLGLLFLPAILLALLLGLEKAAVRYDFSRAHRRRGDARRRNREQDRG